MAVKLIAIDRKYSRKTKYLKTRKQACHGQGKDANNAKRIKPKTITLLLLYTLLNTHY